MGKLRYWCSKLLRNVKLRMQCGIQVLWGAILATAQGWDDKVPGHLHKVGSAADWTLCNRGTLIMTPSSPLTLDMKSLFLLQSLALAIFLLPFRSFLGLI